MSGGASEWRDDRGSPLLREGAVLRSCGVADFEVLTLLGGGCNGIAVLVRCKKVDHPFPWKTYALKVIRNYGAASTASLRNKYAAEFMMFGALGHHKRVVKCWNEFIDVLPPAILALFSDEDRTLMVMNEFGVPRDTVKTQYALFDAHPQHLKGYRMSLGAAVLPAPEFLPLATQVLEGLLFLQSSRVLHRDVKLDNILVTLDGSVCICDLGEALKLPPGDEWSTRVPRDHPGGNQTHTAPEVVDSLRAFLARHDVPHVGVDYSGQASFEAGVVLWELALLQHPVPSYPSGCLQMQPDGTRCVTYAPDDVAAVPEALQHQLQQAGYPTPFPDLIRRMVALDRSKRPSLAQAKRELEGMFDADLTAERARAAAEIAALKQTVTQLSARVQELEAQLAAAAAVSSSSSPQAEAVLVGDPGQSQALPPSATRSHARHSTSTGTGTGTGTSRHGVSRRSPAAHGGAGRREPTTRTAVGSTQSVALPPVAAGPFADVSRTDACAYCTSLREWGYKRTLTEEEAVKLLGLLTAHVTTEAVQKDGLYALRQLLWHSSVNCELFLRLGGLDAVFRALDAHVASKPIQTYGVWALANLAATSDAGKALLQQDADGCVSARIARARTQHIRDTRKKGVVAAVADVEARLGWGAAVVDDAVAEEGAEAGDGDEEG